MLWKKQLKNNGLLYLILDTSEAEKKRIKVIPLVKKIARSEVDLIQLRCENKTDSEILRIGEKLTRILKSAGKIILINNRADIALLLGVDGVHLGKSDISPEKARRLIGKNKIIGKTCHSRKELIMFAKEDVDYLSLGPVFHTPIKPKLNPLSCNVLPARHLTKPIFAVGGINSKNINHVLSRGFKNTAVCRALLFSKNPVLTASTLKKCLKKVS